MVAHFKESGQSKSLTSPSVYPYIQKTLILQHFFWPGRVLTLEPGNWILVELWKEFFVVQKAGNDLRVALCPR